MEFVKVNSQEDIETMSALATKIMKEHYDPIVGSEVNDHMLKKYQSVEGITAEISDGAEYFFVKSDGKNVGFIATDAKEDYMYLSKFYLDKEYRGKGLASEMMSFVKEKTAQIGLPYIMLNVNADNCNTVARYRHFGFDVVEEIMRQVGGGYAVHDYVMRCNLK